MILQEVGDKVCVSTEKEAHSISTSDGDRVSNFVFDQVYDQNSSQEELFNEAVVPIVCIHAAHGCDVFLNAHWFDVSAVHNVYHIEVFG